MGCRGVEASSSRQLMRACAWGSCCCGCYRELRGCLMPERPPWVPSLPALMMVAADEMHLGELLGFFGIALLVDAAPVNPNMAQPEREGKGYAGNRKSFLPLMPICAEAPNKDQSAIIRPTAKIGLMSDPFSLVVATPCTLHVTCLLLPLFSIPNSLNPPKLSGIP